MNEPRELIIARIREENAWSAYRSADTAARMSGAEWRDAYDAADAAYAAYRAAHDRVDALTA